MRFRSFLMIGTGRSHPSGPYQTRLTRWLVSSRRAWVALACVAAGSLGIVASDPARGAGFDCSKASTLVESLICADPTLSALDDEVTAAWGDARRASANPNQLLEAQRAFIRQRGQCQNPRCIADITRQRTAELKAISASAVAPGAGQPAAATPRPTPATPQSGGSAFAGVAPSQPAAVAGAAGGEQTTRDGKIVQTVLAEGMGSTIESAVQNAAENALKQVVGTFVDTNTQIERRTQISEGLRSETRNIRRDMREYSQGSIQGFEVLENRMDGGIHRVTAKVAVRVDDFKVYVKKLTEGGVGVGQSLFAQVATQEKNAENASAIFSARIVTPLLAGEVSHFKVNPARLIDKIPDQEWEALVRERNPGGNMTVPNGLDKRTIARTYGENFIVVTGMRVLDPSYYQNMENILNQIATSKRTIPTLPPGLFYPNGDCGQGDQRKQCIFLGGEVAGQPIRMYIVKNAIEGPNHGRTHRSPDNLEQLARMYGFPKIGGNNFSDWGYRYYMGYGTGGTHLQRLAPHLLVQLKSADGNVVRETLSPRTCITQRGIGGMSPSDHFQICEIKFGLNFRSADRYSSIATTIVQADPFVLGMTVPSRDLALVRSIELKVVPP